MSELTKCNHCQLKEIKARANSNNEKIKLIPEAVDDWDRGIRVLVYTPGREPDYVEDFVAWFAEVTDHCVC